MSLELLGDFARWWQSPGGDDSHGVEPRVCLVALLLVLEVLNLHVDEWRGLERLRGAWMETTVSLDCGQMGGGSADILSMIGMRAVRQRSVRSVCEGVRLIQVLPGLLMTCTSPIRY